MYWKITYNYVCYENYSPLSLSEADIIWNDVICIRFILLFKYLTLSQDRGDYSPGKDFFISPVNEAQKVYRNHFVSPSVCADSCPAHNYFLLWHWLTILPYLAHGCITMRQCVAYIHDPNTTLTFDLEVAFIGFVAVSSCPTRNLCLLYIVVSYLAHGSVTMRGCVAYIHDPDTTLTFDLKVKSVGFVFGPQLFCPLTWSYYVWHMSVSPCYDVSRTFMTSVWPLTSISKFIFSNSQ